MSYIPVAQRAGTAAVPKTPAAVTPPVAAPTAASAYVPVSQRSTAPAAVPIPTPTQPNVNSPEYAPALKLAPGHSLTIVPRKDNTDVSALDVVKEIPGSIADMAKNIYKGISEPILHPDQEQLDYEKRFIPTPTPGVVATVTAPGRTAAKVITRFLNPGLRPVADDLANIHEVSRPGGIADQVAEGKMPSSYLDEIAVLHKTAPQVVGDVTQAVLSAYAGGEGANLAKTAGGQTLKEAVVHGAKTGMAIGTLFGGAQAASSGSTDPTEIAQMIGGGAAGGGLLGAITSGAIPVSKEVFKQAQKAKAVYDKIPNKQGGFADLGAMSDGIIKKTDKTKNNTPELLIVHNLTPEKLKFADKAGGLANPSLAVINPKLTPFENFGDITLVADRNLIEGQKTHLADAYSPRFPETHSTMDYKSFDQLQKDLAPYYEKLGKDPKKLYHDDRDMIRNIENNPAIALKFLEENNITPSAEGQHYYKGQISEAGLSEKYQSYLDEIHKKYNVTEQLFAGFTPSGKRKYRPVTAEEASKLMNKEKGESFNYGLGSFRSKVAPVKKNFGAVSKEAGRLVDKNAFEIIKETHDKELWDLKDKLEPFAKVWDSSNSFMESDYQLNAIGNVLMGDQGSISRFKEKFPEAPPELLQDVLKFKEKLKMMPTEYFETKFKRPVGINEFKIAVVPDDVPESTIKLLEDKGLKIVKYKKGEKGKTLENLANGTTPENAQNAPTPQAEFPITVQNKKDVPEAVAKAQEAQATGYTPMAKRRAVKVEESAKKLEELSNTPEISASVRKLDESAGLVEPGMPASVEEYNKLPGKEQSAVYDKLPRSLQDEIAQHEFDQIYENEIKHYAGENPITALADDIISGKKKVHSNYAQAKRAGRTQDFRTELKEGLPKDLYSRMFTTDRTKGSGFDEYVQEIRDYTKSDFTSNDLLDAIAKRYEERQQLRAKNAAAKAEAKAKTESQAEEKKYLKDLQRQIVGDMLKKRYTIGERMKFESKAERRGIKKGVVEGLKGKEEIRAKELAKRNVLKQKLHDITHTHGTRAEKINAVAESFSLSDKEVRSILGNRDYRLMTDGGFENLLKEMYGKAEAVKERTMAKIQLEATIKEKQFKKVENLLQVLSKDMKEENKVTTDENKTAQDFIVHDITREELTELFNPSTGKPIPIEKMTTRQLQKFEDILSKYKTGDVFLTVRELETIDNTELKGIKTMREARERMIKRMGGKVPEPGDIVVGELDKFRWDTALAEENVYYKMVVEDTMRAGLEADTRFTHTKEKINELINAARKSRTYNETVKEKIRRAFVPTDEILFTWLEASAEDKAILEKDMTKQELAAGTYIRDIYAEMRDYLVQKKMLDQFRYNYITHVRRGFLEGLTFDGLPQALKELVQKKQEEMAIFNILDTDTKEILPLEKFFSFSLERKGNLIPTKNVARAVTSYVKAFEKKRAFDEVIPKLSIYTKALTPTDLTGRGLEVDRSLKRFFNEWMNTKKGRTSGNFLKQGTSLDMAARATMAYVRLHYLAFSFIGGAASNIGEHVSTYVNLGTKKYALGVKRMNSKQGKAITEKYKGFVGETPWEVLHDASKNLTDKIWEGSLALYRDAAVRANKLHLLGDLTPEEYASGEVSSQRLAEMKLEIGRWRPLEGASSIHGATTEGKLFTQLRSWALPPMRTTIQNLNKLARGLAKKNPDITKTREFQETLRLVTTTSVVALTAMAMANDPKDKSLLGKVRTKMISEAYSLLSSLSPQTLFSAPATAQYVFNLAKALNDIVTLQTTKTTGEMTGINELEKLLVPTAVNQFVGNKKPAPKKSTTGGGLSGRKGLPTLPPLPSLPKLPKL